MAGFVERIRLVFDVDNKGATSGFSNFKREIQQAEGFTGKLKAGLGGITQGFSNFMSTGAGAATVATAVTTGLMKAVNSAEELALKIGKLADATGLSTEAASRWTEVADDLGLGADKIAGLIEKMTKNLGSTPDKFAAMGIEVVKAKDGTADMNATLLNAIDMLDKIQDPTKRAAAEQALFGKSWADASELISMGAGELKKRLDDVSGAKVYSADQIRQAREFRDTMAEIQDVGEDLVITIGKELIPALTTLGGAIKSSVGQGLVKESFSGITKPLEDFAAMLDGKTYQAIAKVAWGSSNLTAELARAREEALKGATSGDEVAASYGSLGTVIDTLRTRMAETTAEHDRVTAAIERQSKASWDLYNAQLALASGVIDLSSAQQGYMGALDALNTTTDDAKTLVNEHVVALNDAEQASLRVAAAAADHAEQQAKLSGKTYEARDAALVQIDALKNLAAGLAPGSELRLFLEQTISSLDHTAQSGRDLADNLQAFVRSGGQVSTRR